MTGKWLVFFTMLSALFVGCSQAQTLGELFTSEFQNWRATDNAEPPEEATVEGRTGYRFSGDLSKVPTAGNGANRFSWKTGLCPIDLSKTASISMSLFLENAPATSVTLYLKSGKGLYVINPTNLENGWNDVVLTPAKLTTEGEPAGLDEIESVQVTMWKRAGKRASVFICDVDTSGTAKKKARKNTGTSAEDIAKRVHRARLFVNALNVAQELMGDRLFKSIGMLGDYYRYKNNEIENNLNKNWSDPGKYGSLEELDGLEKEIERLERELIVESVNIFPAPPDARRGYAALGGYVMKGYPAVARRMNDELRNEVNELRFDWQRNLEGLKRNGITLDLSLEFEQMRAGSEKAFDSIIPDRLFEQRYSFYRTVATERQRVAAGVLQVEQFLKAWRDAIELRRQLGAKLVGVEAPVEAVKNAAQKYRLSVAGGSAYAQQLADERAAHHAMSKLIAAVTASEQNTPVIRPGVSFYSTGRFALGGSWQGLLNSEINHSGLYRDKEEFKLDKEGKLGWSFSFTPPGAGRFEFETLDQSWTHATRRYYYPEKEDKNCVVQDVTWSILAPGTLVNARGPAVQLSDTSVGNPTPPDRIAAVLNGKVTLLGRQDPIKASDLTENWLLLLTENGLPTFPVLVVFEQRPDEITWTREGLEVRRAAGVGRYVVALPYGAAPLSPNYSKAWRVVPEEVLHQVRGVIPLLTHYPITTEEFFAVENDFIHVWSRVSKAVELKSDFCTPGSPYVPLPPIYAMSLPLNLGLQVDSPLSDPLMMTKYGPYRVTKDPVLSYRLPRARMWDRTELRPVGEDGDLVKRFNEELFPRFAGECSRFNEVGEFMPGYLMMTPENREKTRYYKDPLELEAGMADREPLRMAFTDPVSRRRDFSIDPVTGQSYWVFGWRGSRHDVKMRGDVPNFASFWMNGPYCYAKYFGAWDMLERNWDTFRDAYSAVPARHDWAVPGHDCMSSGFLFSGDMLGDGWRPHHMMANTAAVLGHIEDERLAQYLGSVTLLTAATLAHPGTIPYRQRLVNMPGSRNKEMIVGMRATDTGMSAVNGSETGAVAGPGAWQNLYALSGCVTYDYPIYDGMLTLYPEVGHYQFQGFPRAFPSWLDESYLGVKETPIGLVNVTGSANELGYLSWTGTDKKHVAECWGKYIDLFLKGKMPGSVAFSASTMISAEYPYFIAQGNPLWLASWDKAKLDDGVYDRKSHVATIHLTAPRPGVLKLACAAPVQAVRINDQAITEKQYVCRPEKQELEVPFSEGKQTVTIQLGDGGKTAQAPGIMRIARTSEPVPVTAPPLTSDYGTLSIPVLGGDLKVGNVIPVSLASVVNRGYCDDPAPGGVRGTHDDGESWALPKGEVILRGVPFTLIDPAANKGKTCLVLKGVAKDQFPARVTNVRVDRRVKRLFFLHGTAYTQSAGIALTYVLHFKTAGTRELNMRVGQEIGEWKIPPGGFNDKSVPLDRLPDLPDARGSVVWPAKPGTKADGLGVGGYVYAWENNVKEAGVSFEGGIQRGLDVLDSIDIISDGKSVPMVFAITAEPAE